MIENRIKRMRISTALIETFITSGDKIFHYKIIENILEEGTRIIDIRSDSSTFPYFWFILSNPNWPELEDGDPIPELPSPVFEDLRVFNSDMN